eukprot:TRINITY_DN4779_c0_g1_i1.p1 TRINITY_DN4779_c0_g1~~TRINITY_DN4779_c0_g1_i1.p1  ORF type:complete len:102 (+),score=16.78 TRINITY_DN4779_c0_g1_i1:89-394(+)
MHSVNQPSTFSKFNNKVVVLCSFDLVSKFLLACFLLRKCSELFTPKRTQTHQKVDPPTQSTVTNKQSLPSPDLSCAKLKATRIKLDESDCCFQVMIVTKKT